MNRTSAVETSTHAVSPELMPLGSDALAKDGNKANDAAIDTVSRALGNMVKMFKEKIQRQIICL